MKQTVMLALLLVAPLVSQPVAGETAIGSTDATSFVNEATISAPVAAVWNIWASSEGYKALGVAKADVDFRIAGLIRSHYRATGVLGDDETIENRILAYEPQRMIAIRIDRPPKSFPFKEAWKKAWTVITFTDMGNERTHLRIASMGFSPDQDSVSMRRLPTSPST